MSQNSIWDVQSALFAQLTSNNNLIALLVDGANSVYDHVLSGAAFPYIVFGESNAREIEGGAFEVTITIHSYSKSSGMNEVKQIMTAIYDCLHDAEFNIPNHNLIMCLMEASNARLEADGKTHYGVQQFSVITESV